MINTKTYISKANTIIKDNHANTGLNPVMELNYGNMLTRGILYFDHSKVKKMVEDKTYPDINKLKHILRMTNTSSIVSKDINRPCMASQYDGNKLRAISFDLIFFLIPCEWDNGRGFDYVMDMFNGNHRGISTQGSNWYQYRDYFKWDNEGIYSTDRLSTEMDLFTSKNGNLSKIIFGYQHFDYGNEDISLDITCIFNKFITGEIKNYGIGIAFAPSFENLTLEKTQYVGFFTQHTNSFFEPYVETTYDEIIDDDRSNFYLDKDNKLYFYSIVGGKYDNLDELPICEINGLKYTSKQATKGIYYIDLNLSSNEYDADTMYYDIWKNIMYKGRHINDVELNFVTKSSNEYFTFGLPMSNTNEDNDFIPSVYGISFKEQIKKGDIRKLNIECNIPYTSNQLLSVDGLEYRLYVLQAERQYDVISWSKVEKGYNENYILLNTSEMIPSRYFIDIRVKNNLELKYYRNIIEFDIINDITETYK